MKEPAATSPFAAMTRQEQRHHWNVWHAQRNAAPTVELTQGQAQSVRSLPREEQAQEDERPQESAPDASRDTQTQSQQTQQSRQTQQSQQTQQNQQPQQQSAPAMPKPHRGQYQAVLKRMEQAGRHTSAFASANPPSAAAMRTAAPVSATISAAGAMTVSDPASVPRSASGATSIPMSAPISAPDAPENSTVQPESGNE